MDKQSQVPAETNLQPEIIERVMRVIRQNHLHPEELSTIVLSTTTKVIDELHMEEGFLDLRIDLENEFGLDELPEYAFDEARTIGDIALLFQRALNGEDLDPDASLVSFVPEQDEDADRTSLVRRAADVEFYEQGERKARIRRVVPRWRLFGSADGNMSGGFLDYIVLDPNGPEHPRQEFLMEAMRAGEGVRWFHVAAHADLDFVKEAAGNWVRDGGKIRQFHDLTEVSVDRTNH